MKKILIIITVLVMIILCVAGCSGVSYNAKIYNTLMNPMPSQATSYHEYIQSTEELGKLYDKYENTYGTQQMEEDIFFNDKYNKEFFNKKCLLFIFDKDALLKSETKVASVVLEGDVLKVTASHLEGVYDESHSVVLIFLELDKEYAGKEVELMWPGYLQEYKYYKSYASVQQICKLDL